MAAYGSSDWMPLSWGSCSEKVPSEVLNLEISDSKKILNRKLKEGITNFYGKMI